MCWERRPDGPAAESGAKKTGRPEPTSEGQWFRGDWSNRVSSWLLFSVRGRSFAPVVCPAGQSTFGKLAFFRQGRGPVVSSLKVTRIVA